MHVYIIGISNMCKRPLYWNMDLAIDINTLRPDDEYMCNWTAITRTNQNENVTILKKFSPLATL